MVYRPYKDFNLLIVIRKFPAKQCFVQAIGYQKLLPHLTLHYRK
jgi:hypothetical protein